MGVFWRNVYYYYNEPKAISLLIRRFSNTDQSTVYLYPLPLVSWLTMVRLQNGYTNANDTITLFSIQMHMSMHDVVVTGIVIMTDLIKVYHDNNCGEDYLMHAHLHLNRKYRYCIVCVIVRISQTH